MSEGKPPTHVLVAWCDPTSDGQRLEREEYIPFSDFVRFVREETVRQALEAIRENNERALAEDRMLRARSEDLERSYRPAGLAEEAAALRSRIAAAQRSMAPPQNLEEFQRQIAERNEAETGYADVTSRTYAARYTVPWDPKLPPKKEDE